MKEDEMDVGDEKCIQNFSLVRNTEGKWPLGRPKHR